MCELETKLHSFMCKYPIGPSTFVEKTISPVNCLGTPKDFCDLTAFSASWTAAAAASPPVPTH